MRAEKVVEDPKEGEGYDYCPWCHSDQVWIGYKFPDHTQEAGCEDCGKDWRINFAIKSITMIGGSS